MPGMDPDGSLRASSKEQPALELPIIAPEENKQAGQAPAVLEWDAWRFRHVAVLQAAARNSGHVELAEDRLTGRLVAIKAMPHSWTSDGPEAFLAERPQETELPWQDVATTQRLSKVARLECICDFVGVFWRESEQAGKELCLAVSYCAGGDLFSWLERSLECVEMDREARTRALSIHVFKAVHDIHSQGVAHGDLSLENVLLADAESETPSVRVIDFGAASTDGRGHGVRGKPSYQAPEMYQGEEYDPFLADAFALGVMIFTLLVGNYPWRSTRPLLCPRFRFFADRGLPAYLARQKIKRPDGTIASVAEMLSPAAVSLLTQLLAIDPAARLTVSAALEHPWFAEGASQAAHLAC